MSGNIRCDTCSNYIYDEELDEYVCDINVDEDEYARFLNDSNYNCTFYRLDDEYKTVKKQN